MNYFGFFICGIDLHPAPRYHLKYCAPKLKLAYEEDGMPCSVYVLGDGERDADAAFEFGCAPVNVVVTMDEYPGMDFLLSHAYKAFGRIDGVFFIPYVEDPPAMFSEHPIVGKANVEWMQRALEDYAEEADEIAEAWRQELATAAATD